MGEIEGIENTEYRYCVRCRSFKGELLKVPVNVFKEAMAYSRQTCDFINQSIFRKKKYFDLQSDKVSVLRNQLKFSIDFDLYRSINNRQKPPLEITAENISFAQPKPVPEPASKLPLVLPKLPAKKRVRLAHRSSLDDRMDPRLGMVKYLLQRPAATLKIERSNVSMAKVRKVLQVSGVGHLS